MGEEWDIIFISISLFIIHKIEVKFLNKNWTAQHYIIFNWPIHEDNKPNCEETGWGNLSETAYLDQS